MSKVTTKEEVFVDVYQTEDGYEIYFLGSVKFQKQKYMADVCQDSGFFYYADDLDTFLEEHADEIVVVTDFRD